MPEEKSHSIFDLLKNSSLIIAVLMQFGWFIWQAARVDNSISVNANETIELRDRIDSIEKSYSEKIRSLEIAYNEVKGFNIRQDMVGKQLAKQLDNLEIKIDKLMALQMRVKKMY